MKKLFVLILSMIVFVSCGTAQKDQSWKGQPYEKVLNEISKNYDLVLEDGKAISSFNGMFRVCDKKTHTDLRSNAQDIDVIKKLIIKKLSFEPEKSYEPQYNNDFLTWETAKYEIQIMSGRGKSEMIGKELMFFEGTITIWIELL
jgi:hypothetical protein